MIREMRRISGTGKAMCALSLKLARGLGTELMKAMVDCLRRSGCRRVSLSVQKANYAVKMYTKLGFEIFSETAEDYIMLVKI